MFQSWHNFKKKYKTLNNMNIELQRTFNLESPLLKMARVINAYEKTEIVDLCYHTGVYSCFPAEHVELHQHKIAYK